MKILYIGHYKEGSGWSQSAIDLIQCIDSVGVDIVCRNIKLTNKDANIPEKVLNLEKKDLQNVDVCIQHVLPHHLIATSKFKKNITAYIGESDNLCFNTWLDNLNLMDEIWVPNQTLVNHLVSSNIDEKKIKKVPYPFDISKYNTKQEKKINFHENDYKFKFYYIADLNDRKNIESVVRCFHSEFESHEPVALVLKVKKYGLSDEKLNQHIVEICNNIKRNMRMYKNLENYHKEIIISENLDDDFITNLHIACDCLINTTHGEGWSIPAFDAMCYGNTPICCNEGGPKEFIDHNDANTGTLINGLMTVCNHSDPAFPNIFTGRENWFTPDEKEIKKAMRYYYENKNIINRAAGLKNAEKYSYTSVGNIIKELLNV